MSKGTSPVAFVVVVVLLPLGVVVVALLEDVVDDVDVVVVGTAQANSMTLQQACSSAKVQVSTFVGRIIQGSGLASHWHVNLYMLG